MKANSQIPLSKLAIDKYSCNQLKEMWITNVQELLGLAAALNSSENLISKTCGEKSEILKAVAVARSAIPEKQLQRFEHPKAGGGVGCLFEPQILESYEKYGKLRPMAAKPAGIFNEKLPPTIRLFDKMPPVRNQGSRGTCVAFATIALREYLHRSDPNLSEQFLYYACKELDGLPGSGTYIHTAMAALNEYGVCEENIWTYNPVQTNNEGQGPPPNSALENAKNYFLSSSRAVEPNLVKQYKQMLTGKEEISGMPIVIGALVFDSWYMSPETHRTGKITMPLPKEKPTSGHAMCVVGYVDDSDVPGGGYFILRNSWGGNWAADSPEAAGHALMPYAYVENYVFESFTGPPNFESSVKINKKQIYKICKLKEATPDVSHELLPKGTEVIEANNKIRKNTRENRRDVWIWSESIPNEMAATLEKCKISSHSFLSKINENISDARKRHELFPDKILPLWSFLIPWKLKIKKVDPKKYNLTDFIVKKIINNCKLPEKTSFPDNWQQILRECNIAETYRISSYKATVDVVALSICQLQINRQNVDNEIIPEIIPPTQDIFNSAIVAYKECVKNDSNYHKPLFTFFTFGSCIGYAKGIAPVISGESMIILSSFDTNDKKWEIHRINELYNSIAMRNFIDFLKPETYGERASKIRAIVDNILELNDSVHITKVMNETGYRYSIILKSFFDLQNNFNYRVFPSKEGIFINERIDLSKLKPSALQSKFKLLTKELFTWLVPLGACIINFFIINLIFNKPSNIITFLFPVLLFVYPGKIINKIWQRNKRYKENL